MNGMTETMISYGRLTPLQWRHHNLPRVRFGTPPLHLSSTIQFHVSKLERGGRKDNFPYPITSLSFTQPPPPPNNNNNNNGGGDGWNPFEGGWWWDRSHIPLPHLLLSILGLYGGRFVGDTEWWCWSSSTKTTVLVFLLSLLCGSFNLSPAIARTPATDGDDDDLIWEVRGSKRTSCLTPDPSKDAFVAPPVFSLLGSNWRDHSLRLGHGLKDLLMKLMLPEGYPDSVSNDYLEYSLWRGVQGVASQISGVLSTQALLYAVGLGKGAIPTAAAVNWVLKDGIGYLSKIMLSKFGRHFDVNPKGWRLFADLMENAAYGLELLTPAFPNLFVTLGAAAGAGRSAAALIQSATRSCFYAGFATKRNFAEVIAKGEAQGMVSKFVGIMLGIALANYISTSTPLAIASFTAVTAVHMFCNLKSYQSIQLRTLNPYRASLMFSEYLLSGQIPSVKEVNNEEPLFPALQLVNVNPTHKGGSHILSAEAKYAAALIDRRLQLGSKLSEVVTNKEDALALIDLFSDEGYMLAERKGKFCVILKESSSPQDMLKSVFHVNYLYWLERNAVLEPRTIAEDCKPGGRLQVSLDYVRREFNYVQQDGQVLGWVTNGLIARPLPTRIRVGYAGVL
ncbi:hypothetical protein QJS04_geneDACA012274 [Acorus gramineus]|uniref:Protein root UVB sensitive 1, chloroplastic n=1 Tax=Acorus gramineus TaxID=55184 RepID=A0AAV9B8M6_ACOGR|nr:hypothetical protein QJS04_geneDACA012274 [Acorus gramineus]